MSKALQHGGHCRAHLVFSLAEVLFTDLELTAAEEQLHFNPFRVDFPLYIHALNKIDIGNSFQSSVICSQNPSGICIHADMFRARTYLNY